MQRFFYSLARSLAWLSAISRGPVPTMRRGRNRVIMRGMGRIFRL